MCLIVVLGLNSRLSRGWMRGVLACSAVEDAVCWADAASVVAAALLLQTWRGCAAAAAASRCNCAGRIKAFPACNFMLHALMPCRHVCIVFANRCVATVVL